jgi:prepilin-type processing-associated H-X9-DG protein
VDRHQGSAHYLYADGHVALITEATIAAWCDRPFVFVKPDEAAEAYDTSD